MSNKKLKLDFSSIFFVLTFTLACLTTNSDRLGGYWHDYGNTIIFTKYILIFAFVCIATYLNKNRLEFVSKFNCFATIIITALVIFDYYVTEFSGSQFLFRVWWIGSIFVAESGVFLTTTLFSKKNYKEFFKRFWIGFTPIYLFLFFLCFIRTPFSSNATTNMQIGNGTFLMLKAFIENIHCSFEAPLIFFGNLLVFVPLSFILYSVFNLKNVKLISIIGILIPFIIEGYQFIFKCGNTDIDDIILNIGGFIIGLMIFISIKKKRL